MFTSRGRARGRRTIHRLGWKRLQVHSLESRIAPAQLLVTSAADDGGAGTLRSIIAVANANAQADTITFSASVTSITLASGQLTISDENELLIDGAENVTINAGPTASATNRHFLLNNPVGALVEFRGLTLANGNVVGANGGSILILSQEVLVTNTTFTTNKADLGGAICCATILDATITVNNSEFSNNTSTSHGGAIYYAGRSKLIIDDSVFSKNSGAKGGAIFVDLDSDVYINDSIISDNKASSDGGGIFQQKGNFLVMYRCTIANNVSGGNGGGFGFVDNTNTLGAKITDSTILGNSSGQSGGGLYVEGLTVWVTRSTIANNSSTSGGGIATNSTLQEVLLTLSNSTIAGNKANYGGGIFADGFTNTGTWLDLYNCTIATNQAYVRGGGLYLEPEGGFTHLYSCLISANVSADIRDIYCAYPGAGITAVRNLIGQISTSLNISYSFNLMNQNNPGIFPLANYGGPTLTVGLRYTSPALDAGSNYSGSSIDQRGFPREVPDDFTDIGSVEGFELLPFLSSVAPINPVKTAGSTSYDLTVSYDSPLGIDLASIDATDILVNGKAPIDQIALKGVTKSGNVATAVYSITPPGGSWDAFDSGSYQIGLAPNAVWDLGGPTNCIAAQSLGTLLVAVPGGFVIDNLSDINDANYGPGQFSFREALDLANLDPNTLDTITFDSAVFGSKQSLQPNNEFAISSPVVINGPGAAILTLDGSKLRRVFNLTGSYSTVLSGLTFSNGFSAADGGAIRSTQTLTVADCDFQDNAASTVGGAINIASGSGSTPALTLLRTTFAGNMASKGGAVNNETSGAMTIQVSAFAENTATGYGGAIALATSRLKINDSTLNDNAAANGGAIYSQFGSYSPEINNTTLSGNSATSFGGAIHLGNFGATLSIRNCTLTNNDAGTAGGAVFRGSGVGSANLVSTIISGNQALSGPDLFFDVPTVVTANNSLIGVADNGNFTLNGNSNLSGTKLAPIDAKLGPLANNGGPTLTHALLLGSPAINAGSNTNKLATDQRGTGFNRVVGGQADIGAFEVQAPPPRALSFQVNDGSVQRSIITSFKVSFSEVVSFPNGASAAFMLIRIGPGAPNGNVSINAVVSGPDVTITLNNGGTIALDPGGSLPDGRYELTIISNKVVGLGGFLDGDSNGSAGDNALFATHRLFGDSNGDGVVSAFDFNSIRLAYGSPSPIFDFDNDGIVSASDFQQFRMRYGVLI